MKHGGKLLSRFMEPKGANGVLKFIGFSTAETNCVLEEPLRVGKDSELVIRKNGIYVELVLRRRDDAPR